MSVYTKPISRIDAHDLQELLTERAVENIRLEFKLQVPEKDDTLKKLSSFANTFGGIMVMGAKADSSNGRILDLPGVDPVDGYKQKVVDWCFGGANPPLTVEVSDPIPVPAGNEKVSYVIRADESDIAPHFLNGRKGFWIRTDEFSTRFEAQLANETELRQLLDRRKAIVERRSQIIERARKRFSTSLVKLYGDAGGQTAERGSFLEICIVPRFPARPLCEQTQLARLILNNKLPWRNVGFPRTGHGIISQHESAIILNPISQGSIFEVNIWGMAFYGARTDGNPDGTEGIHLYNFLGCMLAFVHHAGKMLKALGHAGPVIVEMALSSILNTEWLFEEQGFVPTSRPGSELDDSLTIRIETTTEELFEKPNRAALDLLRNVFFSISWPDWVDTPDKLAHLIQQGYKYNIWRPQPTLADLGL